MARLGLRPVFRSLAIALLAGNVAVAAASTLSIGKVTTNGRSNPLGIGGDDKGVSQRNAVLRLGRARERSLAEAELTKRVNAHA